MIGQFDCMSPGELKIVAADARGDLFVPCRGACDAFREHGNCRHYLDGMEDDDNEIPEFEVASCRS